MACHVYSFYSPGHMKAGPKDSVLLLSTSISVTSGSELWVKEGK